MQHQQEIWLMKRGLSNMTKFKGGMMLLWAITQADKREKLFAVAYHKLDRQKISSFQLWEGKIENNEHYLVNKVFVLHLEPHQKMFYRRRVAIDGKTSERKSVKHLIGYCTKEGDCRFAVIDEDTHIVEWFDHFIKDHKYAYSIKFREDEKWPK